MSVDQREAETNVIKGPPLSCDCHLHVFGDPATYPYSADKRNSPPAVPLAEYMAGYQDFARRCGIKRMVFTQLKLTAPYRVATEPGYADSTLIAKALIAAAPERIIWGSDYPYLSNAHRVNSIDLFNLVRNGCRMRRRGRGYSLIILRSYLDLSNISI